MPSTRVAEAPTFRPSAEEFGDPLAYIASIRQQAECYGICKARALGLVWGCLSWQ